MSNKSLIRYCFKFGGARKIVLYLSFNVACVNIHNSMICSKNALITHACIKFMLIPK